MVTLERFAGMGHLDRWEKRGFNALAILLSSLVSLSLGSLLQLLGNMIRWRLLAREVNKPQDVDLILGMAQPTGALRLIWYHTKNGRWTVTTIVVAGFLLINIIGRLSVAAFGLTFDLNELPGIEYPVMVTDWGSKDWLDLPRGSLTGDFEKDREFLFPDFTQVNGHATVGLVTVPIEFNHTDQGNYNVTNLGGQGIDRKVEGDTITYSYSLKEYQGLETTSSKNKVIHSSSSCVGRTFYENDVYEGGELVGSIESVNANSEGFLQVLPGIFNFSNLVTDYLWAAPLNFGNLSAPAGCATTYIYIQKQYRGARNRTGTYFECTTCLTDENNRLGIGTDLLHGLAPGNSSYTANLLLFVGTFEIFYTYSWAASLAMRFYSSLGRAPGFLNNLDVNLTGEFPRGKVSSYAELYAAHLAARLPLLAIIGAETKLPKVPRDMGASERPFVNVVLEVRWPRAIGVLAAISVGQLVVIAVVIFACRKVFIRDHDSYLSIARLMKTAMEKVEGNSTDTGRELAEHLGNKEVRMRYGTRLKESGIYEVDLWNDVDKSFPNAMYG
ncbi:uncharacterized protein DFL_008312 [Arthrobotrys flagrans]|uniref:Uncharacterized protein n=1 Tax=Arthrobotrys flagrans TaxID=97331 RepID=A0A436ZNH3_ARTFL|nr:hypothetical protein DFL_008312 [Arthrobotrys flagrans]